MNISLDDFFAAPPSKELIWASGHGGEDISDRIVATETTTETDSKKAIAEELKSATTSESISSDSADGYKFPDMMALQPWKVLHQGKTSKELLISIGQLSHERRDTEGSRCSYFDVRDELCAIGSMLNERGDYAPRVRGMRVPVSHTRCTPYPLEQQTLSNDRQILDLHWIYRQRMLTVDVPGFDGMLDPGLPFDLAKAANFVQRVGAAEKKAELLGLTEYVQLQLAAIQTKSASDRWRTIRESMQKNRSKIFAHANAPSSRLPADATHRLPDIYLALRVARGSPSIGADAYRWLTAHDIGSKEMSKRLRWLRSIGVIAKSE